MQEQKESEGPKGTKKGTKRPYQSEWNKEKVNGELDAAATREQIGGNGMMYLMSCAVLTKMYNVAKMSPNAQIQAMVDGVLFGDRGRSINQIKDDASADLYELE